MLHINLNTSLKYIFNELFLNYSIIELFKIARDNIYSIIGASKTFWTRQETINKYTIY